MHYYIYAEKDATIYSGSRSYGSVKSEDQNTGVDEIIEIDDGTDTSNNINKPIEIESQKSNSEEKDFKKDIVNNENSLHDIILESIGKINNYI